MFYQKHLYYIRNWRFFLKKSCLWLWNIKKCKAKSVFIFWKQSYNKFENFVFITKCKMNTLKIVATNYRLSWFSQIIQLCKKFVKRHTFQLFFATLLKIVNISTFVKQSPGDSLKCCWLAFCNFFCCSLFWIVNLVCSKSFDYMHIIYFFSTI